MGERRAWWVVQGVSREQVLQTFGLRATGAAEIDGDWDIDCAALSDGWTLVRFDPYSGGLTDRVLAAVSSDCRVITCSINGTSMVSAAGEWVRGKQLWSIEHDGGHEGVYDLETEGTLPACYEPLRESVLAAQALADQATELELRKPRSTRDRYAAMGVDLVFDLPIDVVGVLTGYRHRDMKVPCTLVFEALVLK